MSATFYPSAIDFPDGWPVDNSIGPITIPYDGPSLATADILFSMGLLQLTNPDDITIEPYVGPDLPVPGQEHLFVFESGAWVQITTGVGELYTPTETIIIHVFEPPTAGDMVYKLSVDYNAIGAMELKKRDLAAGSWHICPVPPA